VALVARLAIRHSAILDSMPAGGHGWRRGENWRERERAAGEALAEAERREADARAQARGADLPRDLTADDVDAMLARGEVAAVRTFLAAVFASVVVRRAGRWREPVADRARVLRRDEAPAGNLALIAHVAAA
jgi:hypothetical protein